MQADPSLELSTGQTAGIAVGVIVGVGLLLFIIGVIWWKRRRSRGQVQQAVAHTDKPELHGEAKERPEMASTMIQELEHQHKPAEADDPAVRVELHGGWGGWEAPAATDRRPPP